MANTIQLIEQYSRDAFDSIYADESKTKILENGSKFIDPNFKEAGYVKVMSLLTDGLSDYYRVNNGDSGSNYTHYPQSDGYKVGNLKASWELFRLEYDRGKQFQIDNMDNEETAGLIAGNLLSEFIRTRVIPEIDAVRFSRMASKCSSTLGNLVTEDISANTIIGKFNEAFEWLAEREVPAEDQVIFVSTAVMTQIRNTTELYRRLSQTEYKSAEGVSFTIDTYEGRPIIEVSPSRFFTNVQTGDNGYYAGTGSKVINFMVCSRKAVVPIVKLNKSKVWTPEQVQNFDGYKLNFRLYHDVIIPKNKIAGIYTSVSSTASASAKSNLLSVDMIVDDDEYTVREYFTTPAGILVDKLIYSTAEIAVGSVYTEGATNQEITVGTPFEAISTETKAYIVATDSNNVVIATSGEITLPTE